jgi:hypothetical protein
VTFSKIKCPYISKEEIWKVAEKFRKEYWQDATLPVDIEQIVENRLKLDIEPKHDLLNDLDIDAYLRIDLTGIVVDHNCFMNERYINRLRFSLAHELGHLFLHKDTYSTFSIEDSETWKNFMSEIPDQQYGFFEYQANEFAGRVLVPRESLISELERCVQMVKEAGLQQLIESDPGSVLSSISPMLCKPFGVSNAVIEMRVAREELWPLKN